jgi:hypothetical protein
MGVAAAMIFISGQANSGGDYSNRELQLQDLEDASLDSQPLTDRSDKGNGHE